MCSVARHEIGSTDLLLPWMVSPAASMFIEICVKQRLWLRTAKVQNNIKFLKNEGEMCFFYRQCTSVSFCHFVILFLHFPQKPYISSLTSLVSLSCQLIFLSPHAPFSPISSFLISPYATLFFSFYCIFFLYFGRTDIWNPGSRILYLSCSAILLWLFSLFSCFLHFCGLHAPFLFQLYTAGDKTRHNGQEAPIVSIMSFCVVA